MKREMYPLDVHSEISMNARGKMDTKGFIVRIILVGLTLLSSIVGYFIFGYIAIPFLGFMVGLIFGIFLSMIIWNRITEKEEAQMENPDENKTMKFFKLSLGQESFIDNIPVIEYTNGDKAIVLSLNLGNQTRSGQGVLEDFLDNLFYLCHKQQIKLRSFTTIEEWEDSDIYERLLKVYGDIHDTKLKNVLFESINIQSMDFSKSNICQINFIFIDRESSLHNLRSVIDYVESFKADNLKLSSLRAMRWNTQEKSVKLFCRFLGIKLIDSSPVSNDKAVYLDTKALVRPFSSDLFYSSPRLTSHLTNTLAVKLRSPKQKKGLSK